MPFPTRVLASALAVLGGVATIALAAPSAADPDIDGESAAAVIDELQEQGYGVMVNGAPAGDTSLLETCRVTSIHNPGDPTADPTTTTPIYVDVSCPITR